MPHAGKEFFPSCEPKYVRHDKKKEEGEKAGLHEKYILYDFLFFSFSLSSSSLLGLLFQDPAKDSVIYGKKKKIYKLATPDKEKRSSLNTTVGDLEPRFPAEEILLPRYYSVLYTK